MRAIPTIPRFEKSSIKKWGSQPRGVFPKGNHKTLFKGLVSKQELVLEEWFWVVVLSVVETAGPCIYCQEVEKVLQAKVLKYLLLVHC